MKKVWKAGVAGLAVLSLGAVGFVGTTAAVAAPVDKVITVPAPAQGATAHTFNVYQIFVGDISQDGDTLSNVKWGKHGTGTEGAQVSDKDLETLAALTAETDKSDAEKAKAIAAYVKKENGKFVSTDLTVTAGNELTVPSGYYLLEDTTESTGGDANNIYIVAVNGDTTITPKNKTVTSSKNVKDADDTAGTTSDWQDSADHDINDTIEYRLVFTLPANYADFEKYQLNFVDDMGYGLTYKAGSSKILVGAETDTNKPVAIADPSNVTGQNKPNSTTDTYTSAFDHTTDTTKKGIVWKWSFADLKTDDTFVAAANGTTITLTYQAILNDKAVLGAEGNPNQYHAEYSNDFYTDGLGETPNDKNKVFTYQFDVNKVDKDTKPLYNGAGFTLYKKSPTAAPEGDPVADTIHKDGFVWKQVGNEQFVSNADDENPTNTISYKGIDDGTYLVRETTTPDGYTTAADVEFALTATHDTKSDDPTLTKVETTNNAVTVSDNKISTDIVNKMGSNLPETGGMGTVVLYTAGVAIVLIAGIGLTIALRRRQA